MIRIELENRSGAAVDEPALADLCRRVLAAEGVGDGDLGVRLEEPGRMRELKREHLGVDEATDVLSFPIDGRDELPAGVPRQLGDVVLCPQVVGDAWRGPLVHGLLHLLGYDHGARMERRERELQG
ncbi:MAG TPA: rRNA maturation RNase YbeY [Gaiellaceae bacterium]|nr:rRNA maturation RNase YbeY [Gaiellaceae bacterium]